MYNMMYSIIIHQLNNYLFYLAARAREGTEKIDHDVKRRAERLHHVATVRDLHFLTVAKTKKKEIV